MSHFSDYYVVYQRVGEHAMVLVGHKNDTPRALTANQFQEDTNRWFYFLNGFRDEDVSQGIHHQLCNLHMSGRKMMVKRELYLALRHIEIAGAQWLRAVIINDDDTYHDDYHYLNFYENPVDEDYAYYDFVDFDKSEYKAKKYADYLPPLYTFKKIVLSQEKLAAVPLEKRLIWNDIHTTNCLAVHKSVKEIMEKYHPLDCRFTRIEEYQENMGTRAEYDADGNLI
ncbi:hypothetical protein EWS92_01785 [Vibrio vulnificus]|uniref:hypothetical protein n=1 Tax=Vibrio vulnificus TaxID=672 RepID=UPI000A2043AD|nr:hypothetical protein [Vibrio vulnificus]ARN66661.1 hypothetical protein FORC36_2144 [Vibrio vulnificus]EGR0787393.1 hypothetical protein [Vibrio vulnificus]EGR0795775.1 hypothetical protein [Vibrio vulnificus]EGR0813441.1 hypothetical protein [Vibrio vulnificus]EGR0825281.1 hypothetical protein [Vibrio vulnificus]